MEAIGMKRSDLVRTVEMVLSEEEGTVPLDGVRAAQLSEPAPADRFGRYSDEELQTVKLWFICRCSQNSVSPEKVFSFPCIQRWST